MTPEEETAWHARRKAEAEFLATPIGAAYNRMVTRLGNAWVTDSSEHSSDKRMKEAWARADQATREFRVLLDQLIEKAAKADAPKT